MGAHQSCPGYVDEPFASLVADYPGPETYGQGDFRVEWGPVFHRGRLDGTARVLVLGQDPATHETISRRILVGEAGQRAQGLLAKLGVTSSYVMVNVYLYSVFGQSAGYRNLKDAAIAEYRHRWLDALLLGSDVTAVVAFGTLAHRAFGVWADSSPERGERAEGLHVAKLRHPTYAEGSARASGRPLEDTTAEQLADWNERFGELAAALQAPVTPGAPAYGSAWAAGDLVEIPEADLPPGAPAWWRQVEPWSVRDGVDAQEKRATIKVIVPKEARTWPEL